MQHSKPDTSPLRVTILSDSFIQRASLKELLREQGSEIVYENTLGGVDKSDLKIPTDVLLVDLESAGDSSLNKLEFILDNNTVPVLFNDGSTIPADNGPVRDDWINNLTHKLYNLANKDLVKTTRPSVSSRISNEINKNRVAVISRSNTRRTVLKHILLQQGLRHVNAIDYSIVDIEKLKKNTHILLIDQHNLRTTDNTVLNKVKNQHKLGYIICNSSKIPVTAEERHELGDKLLKKLTTKATKHAMNSHAADPVALFESNSFIHKNHAPLSNTFTSKTMHDNSNTIVNKTSEEQTSKNSAKEASLFKQDPVHWADRLSDALAGVRENLKSIDNNKITGLFKNKTTADDNADLTPQTETTSKVVQLPVKNKDKQKVKEKNKQIKNTNITENNTNPATTTATTTAQANQPGILDIFNDMVKAVKEVPEEVDISKDIYQQEHQSNTADLDDKNDNNNIEIEIHEEIILEDKSSNVENLAANDIFSDKSDQTSGFHSDFSNFKMDEDFSFNDDAQDNNSELAFEMELRSLKDELEIFEDNYSSLAMPDEMHERVKKRSIFGLSWSNPFK